MLCMASASALALLLGAAADRLEILGDRAARRWWSTSAIRRAISRARSAAPSSDWSSTLGKRVSRCSRSLPLLSSVVTSSSSAARRSVSAPSVRRLLLSISATASASERPCASNWPASCDRSLSVWLVIVWKLAMLRSTSLLADAGLLRDLVHGGDEIGRRA